ncbi:MAG: hypothetical protein P4L33_18790 [Capsulimonadaceae bacterium]|nr:hypothetical protein [Capsulimonadaceae bacterium]
MVRFAIGAGLAIVFCVVVGGCARDDQHAAPQTFTVADLNVSILPACSPVPVGDSLLNVTLKTSSGDPISDAHISSVATTPMTGITTAPRPGTSLGNGRYIVVIHAPISGFYNVRLTIQRAGKRDGFVDYSVWPR